MEKILIIEDTPHLVDDIANILKLKGYEVYSAENGEVGLFKIKEIMPDLILCDIIMPKISGFQVLEFLFNEDQEFSIPFIFITALADHLNMRKGMNLGADDYLIKPFSASELLNAVECRLKKYHSLENKLSRQYYQIEYKTTQKILELGKQLEEQKITIDKISTTNEQYISDLKEKHAQLMHEALKAIEVNTTMQSIAKQLTDELQNKNLPDEQRRIFSDIRNRIRKRSVLLNNWTIFQLKFDQVYPYFSANLIQKYPTLTKQEIILVSAIYTKLNSHQISVILNIKLPSVRKYKYRIKQKFGLSVEEDLTSFILMLPMN